MSLLVKANPSGREIVQVTPASAGWRYVGFSAFRLAPGENLEFAANDREHCVVVLSGVVTVSSDSLYYREIGERQSVFEERSPYAVYLPNGRPLHITAHSAAEIGLASAPGQGRHSPRLIEPHSMQRSVRGKALNTRYVCDILPESEPADALLVVEVITPSGHASSYPPHKHDTDNIPQESVLEETYYHRLKPSQGFAFQRVYTDDRSIDEAMAVEDHDVVMVPRGYHPVVAPYGYDAYYLNVMAGPKREWHFKNDPAHAWIIEQ
ncbi:MAG: 5-deoxy-glucuronate isomerase [Gammaproteobacteria bacterium]